MFAAPKLRDKRLQCHLVVTERTETSFKNKNFKTIQSKNQVFNTIFKQIRYSELIPDKISLEMNVRSWMHTN